jgi:Uma2 family endonuclease
MNRIVIEERVRIPEWVQDLDSFRRWACSDDFPEHGWFSHLAGELWVDTSMERLTHNQLKGAISDVLGPLVRQGRLGLFFHDRMLVTHVGAELSTEPDGMFISHEALRAGSVRLDKGDDTIELLGTPDMVLEVISPTSIQKDTKVLPELYWEAGVKEYWLADSRGEMATFELTRHTKKGYAAVRKRGGWVNSAVFGKSFRLTQESDQHGLTQYNFEVR